MKIKTLLCSLYVAIVLALSAITIPDSTPECSDNEPGIMLLNDLEDYTVTTEN